ncbi:hypothetical protein OQA88_2149 [Cercophora sp. LCS_1]
MQLRLTVSLIVLAVEQVAAQYYVDYLFNPPNLGCSAPNYRTCSNIPSGTCCQLNDEPSAYKTARTGSWGLPGFTVWMSTHPWFADSCDRCETTSAFGCWLNYDPFQNALIVGLPTTCSARRSLAGIDMLSPENNTADTAATGTVTGTAPECTSTVLPDQLTLDGLDYAITDENREEVEQDFRDYLLGNRRFDFAGKWKDAYLGPSDRPHTLEDEQAKEKPSNP